MEKTAGLLSLVITASCGSTPAPPLGPDPGLPSLPCSEVARTIYDWQKRESEVCGTEPSARRELIPLGGGRIIEWTPFTGRNRFWTVGGDPPLGTDAVAEGTSHLRRETILYGLGGGRLLAVHVTDAAYRVLAPPLNLSGPIANEIETTAFSAAFDDPSWGHEILALDDGHLLRWWPGSGAYAVLRYDRAAGRIAPAEVAPFRGTSAALLRGARLVNLGSGSRRLLEWTPHTGSYRIWSYHVSDGAPELFDAAPVFPDARWNDLGEGHELVVVDDGKILVWERATGRITLRQLDPLAPDPLSGPMIGTPTAYGQLQSPDWEAPRRSPIANVVIVLQRGRSFDSYFGRYCGAEPGSRPTCEEGPACCEGMPSAVRGAPACAHVDVGATETHVPKASTACMLAKIDGGTMDGYVNAPGCGDPLDFACVGQGAEAGAAAAYHALAGAGALADRYFQSTLDGDDLNADLNLIYLSKAAHGSSLVTEGGLNQLTFFMSEAGVRYALYLGDPKDNRDQKPPLFYDEHWTHFRWIDEIARDIELEQLPAVSIVIAPSGLNEEPGRGPAAAGIALVTGIVDRLARSPRYQKDALTLVTYLTSGGFFDHVAPPPPPDPTFDRDFSGQPVPYGPRLPLLAIGRLARPGHVSHVALELSSLAVFLEWNWLENGGVGRLGHRDLIAPNIGSLLDPAIGVPVSAAR